MKQEPPNHCGWTAPVFYGDKDFIAGDMTPIGREFKRGTDFQWVKKDARAMYYEIINSSRQ